MVRVLGIDPGSQCTGFGVLDVAGPRLTYVASGVIRTSQEDFAARLWEIFSCVRSVVAQYRPQQIAIERVFVNRNVDSALKLGQARGIAMVVPARAGVPVSEYAPNLVKKSIVGAGHGDKSQVRMMITVLLPTAELTSDDASDALAVAITHAHHRTSVLVKMALT